MKRIDKIALMGTLTLVVGLSMSACKPDIILPEPRGIEGEYQGILTVVDVAAADSAVQAVVMSIRANFTYGYENDTTDSIFGAISICNSSGLYSFAESKMTLTPTDTGGEVCDPSTIPSGPGFSFFKVDIDGTTNEIGDKLFIKQVNNTEETTTEFVLTLLSIP